MALALTPDRLKDLLETEEAWRQSPRWQSLYGASHLHSEQGDWLDVTHRLQRELVEQKLALWFGCPATEDQVEHALRELRTATLAHPQLSRIPLYVRFNRMDPKEEQRVQQEVINLPMSATVRVAALTGMTEPLVDVLKREPAAVTVLIGSSIT